MTIQAFHERFAYLVVVVLTGLIVVVAVAAVWNLVLRILTDLVPSGSFDPSDYTAFQNVFGMMLTVIIALEFKKSLLFLSGWNPAVQLRSVVVIALLSICLKVIVLDLTKSDPRQILALAVAILALGIVYWLVTDPARHPPVESRD